jgi:hypothetical protein
MAFSETDRPLSLHHLQRLTDCFGIIQHANYAVADYRSGYTTDDNARALVAAVRHHQLHGDDLSRELAGRYLAFLLFAHKPDGRFHNFIGYDRQPLDGVGSEDCLGRALWALAWLVLAPPEGGLVGPAEHMFLRALPWVTRLKHPRGRATSITALYRWLQSHPEEKARASELAEPLAGHLVECYREHSGPGWDWLLPEMTYANAKLPEALFRAYQITGQDEFLAVARRTMEFLCETTFAGDVLCLVGNHGWYSSQAEEPTRYDQQPIDAAALVEAAVAGFDATGEADYLRRACAALEWFFGRNEHGTWLYDPETGGCFDALTEAGVNENRGAESAISLLLAQLSVSEARRRISDRVLSGRQAGAPKEGGAPGAVVRAVDSGEKNPSG